MTMTMTMTGGMTRIAALLIPLALAACARPAPATGEAACRAEARANPAAGNVAERLNPAVENPNRRSAVEESVSAAERRAYLQCMRVRGLTPPGTGVEPQRR